jgi:hypothetical protein
VEIPPVLVEAEVPRPLLSDQIAEGFVPKGATRIPTKAVEEAIRLNKEKNSVDLPDGRRVDLRGRSKEGHFDKTTGERVRYPEVHDPKPEHPPGYQQYPRGTQRASRNASPDDIRDAIRHLIDKIINGGRKGN